MKQIANTVTLSYLEEDNKQRVIFRVVPLFTKEGVGFKDAADMFPDEGSLRIVPDKREQSTFKERMRAMGSLCAICLGNDGRELAKVRPNRNYDPAQGEKNQFAIYSDVVCEFSDGSLFEVIDCSQPAAEGGALTKNVLVQQNKVLYGPIAYAQAKERPLACEGLKPFGNDSFLMHTVTLPNGSRHVIYWNPEDIVGWRQRRPLRKRPEDEDYALRPAIAAVKPQEKPEAAAQRSKPEYAQKPEEKPRVSPPEARAEPELPIGSRLNILDTTITFEEQLGKLDQPLPGSSNRLERQDGEEAPREPSPVRYSGTPLFYVQAGAPKLQRKPEQLHHVVEQHIRATREAQPGATLDSNTPYAHVENPVDNVLQAISRAWQDKDSREQTIDMLLMNDGFMHYFMKAARLNGSETHAAAAARAQLEDIEAERLSLLMQMDRVREDAKRQEELIIAAASQKKRAELEGLKADIGALTAQRSALEKAALELDRGLYDGICRKNGIKTLVTRLGVEYGITEMSRHVRAALEAAGFDLSADDSLNIVICFAMYDLIDLASQSEQTARAYAAALIEALGLTQVCAWLSPGEILSITETLADNDRRAPIVAVVSEASHAVRLKGVKTLRLTGTNACRSAEDRQFPVICVPERARREAVPYASCPPVAMRSLFEVRPDGEAVREDGEKWFEKLESDISSAAESKLPEAWEAMRRYMAVAPDCLNAGFIAAADRAICQWLLPNISLSGVDMKGLISMLGGLPEALARIGAV